MLTMNWRIEFVLNDNYCTSEHFATREEAEDWAVNTLDTIYECNSWKLQLRSRVSGVWYDESDVEFYNIADRLESTVELLG